MNRKPNTLWVLVTDSGYGRVFEIERSPARIEEIGSRESPARHKPSRELTSDLSGRESSSATQSGDTKQPRSDPHDEAERQFVREWVEGLQKNHSNGRFEHLLLVADPRTLGRLRESMDTTLQEAVIAEFDLDLTKLSTHDLEPRLRKLLDWPT